MNETRFHTFPLFTLANLILFFCPMADHLNGETEGKSKCNGFPPGLFTKRNDHHGKAKKTCHNG